MLIDWHIASGRSGGIEYSIAFCHAGRFSENLATGCVYETN